MARIFNIREPSVGALHSAPIYFRYGSNKKLVLVDALTANAVLAVHAALSPPQKEKLERMVAGTPGQLEKIVAFCFKHTTLG